MHLLVLGAFWHNSLAPTIGEAINVLMHLLVLGTF